MTPIHGIGKAWNRLQLFAQRTGGTVFLIGIQNFNALGTGEYAGCVGDCLPGADLSVGTFDACFINGAQAIAVNQCLGGNRFSLVRYQGGHPVFCRKPDPATC